MTDAPADELVEAVARAILRANGATLTAGDEHWPAVIAHYRKMVAEYGATYAAGRSLITDAMRNAAVAIEAYEKSKAADPRGKADLRNALEEIAKMEPMAPLGDSGYVVGTMQTLRNCQRIARSALSKFGKEDHPAAPAPLRNEVDPEMETWALEQIGEMVRNETIEECAKVAEQACLVPPDGGSPTEDERKVAEEAARRIRSLFSPLPKGDKP